MRQIAHNGLRTTQGARLPRRRPLGYALILAILLLGAALRMTALEQSPPGFYFDETSEAYDAYSLWRTGRDQHGAVLPIALRSFNDYRMALFSYSLAPLVGLGGLSVFTARLGSAFWGILVIAATYWAGVELFNRPAALTAALLLALSPWHVHFSRITHEANSATMAAALTVALFWRWQREGRARWLLGAATAAALGLYTYAVMKLVLPLLVGALTLLSWREVARRWRQVLGAAALGLLLAAPVLIATLRTPEQLQDHYRQIAVFQPDRPAREAAREALGNFAANLSPRYLFLEGSRDLLFHAGDTGELYPAQAALILAGLAWSVAGRSRRMALIITLVWIAAGILPAALTRQAPDTGHALRTLPVVVPWQLLSGAGIAGLLAFFSTDSTDGTDRKSFPLNSLNPLKKYLRGGLLILLTGWLGMDGLQHFNYYFTHYPVEAAGHFHAGMDAVVQTLDALDDAYEVVYFSCHFNDLPYIDILFFSRYDPAQLQEDLPVIDPVYPDRVTRLGKVYFVCETDALWASGLPGLYVVPANELPDAAPLAVAPGADGRPLAKFVGRAAVNAAAAQWVSQCTAPLPYPPLPPHAAQQLAPGGRQLAYDCTRAWVYPQGGATPGVYVLQEEAHALNMVYSGAPFSAAWPLGQLTQEVRPHIRPFVLYAGLSLALPDGVAAIPAPAEQIPAPDAPTRRSPLALAGPLTLLSVQTYPGERNVVVETWWQVSAGPITRNFSIMAHLLTAQGEMLAVADGLDVAPPLLQPGDVLVQRHTFNVPLSATLWLRTGAYWLDDMTRWPVGGQTAADAVFIPLTPYPSEP